MDTTPQSVAAALGTSRTRVVRAARRLGIGRRTPGGQWRFSPAEIAQLRTALGRVPTAPGYTRTDLRVLAALQRMPRGGLSARAVARHAGSSPTSTAHALLRLEAAGLVRRAVTSIAEGSARRVPIWHLDHRSPRWPELAPLLAAVELPTMEKEKPSTSSVPHRFAHLFWNVDLRRLDLRRDAALIAQRILRSDDLDALAWAARQLPGSAWSVVAGQQRLEPRRRALAGNLAASSRVA